MICGISRQNNAQARPVFGAREVTARSSEIQKIKENLLKAKNEGAIKDTYILRRADSYAKERKTGIATYILGVDDHATVLSRYDVVQGNAEKYKERLQNWCGRIVDLSKPPQKAEELLKEMDDPHFDYSKI